MPMACPALRPCLVAACRSARADPCISCACCLRRPPASKPCLSRRPWPLLPTCRRPQAAPRSRRTACCLRRPAPHTTPGWGRVGGSATAATPAARAEQDGGDWEEQYGRCPPSPPSLTFAPQYQQYQVLGGTGSPQLLDHLPPSQQEQEQQEAEEQQQERQAQLSPDSAALLASAAGAAAAAAKRASVPAGGEGRQWRGHAATFHQLQRVPSFGFAPTPADGMQRRATTGLPPPQDPFAAAGLAAAAAAAAAATCQQLAAGEQQRRQAEQREEERLGAAEARTGTVCFAEAGLEKESSEGKCVGVSAEPSSSAAITTDGDEVRGWLAWCAEQRRATPLAGNAGPRVGAEHGVLLHAALLRAAALHVALPAAPPPLLSRCPALAAPLPLLLTPDPPGVPRSWAWRRLRRDGRCGGTSAGASGAASSASPSASLSS